VEICIVNLAVSMKELDKEQEHQVLTIRKFYCEQSNVSQIAYEFILAVELKFQDEVECRCEMISKVNITLQV